MKTHTLSQDYQHLSPAGAEVRVLINNSMGGIAYCTLRNGKTSKAVTHKTVSEIWHILYRFWRNLA